MILRPATDQLLKRIVFCVLAAVFIAQFVVRRGLYSDGSNFFLGMLEGGSFAFWDVHRITTHFVTQLPTVLALGVGVSSIKFLSFIYSGSLLAAAMGFWVLALYRLRQSDGFWILLTLFCVVYFNAGFFAVGEYNLCFGLFAFCFVYLMQRELSPSDKIILLLGALLFPLTYPATLFLAPVLLLKVAVHLQHEKTLKKRLYWLILSAIFELAIVAGLWEVFMPRDPENFENALSLDVVLANRQFWIASLCAVLIASNIFVQSRVVKSISLYAVFVLLAGLLLSPFQDYARMSYSLRTIETLVLMINGFALIYLYEKLPRISGQIVAAVLGLFLTLAVIDVVNSVGYGSFICKFKNEVNARSGYVAYESTVLQFESVNRLYSSNWTYPLLSLVLRDGVDKAIILNPIWFNGYQPYNVRLYVPDLRRYYLP